ncbi:uncharacterized protein LOC143919997 [Arctopsyche grandis]|uniref:uncharacterized protein LOC143919997 n=1 Tax=Arctopsyche grandis TaxID=121162 RepID=UPI00406D6E6D
METRNKKMQFSLQHTESVITYSVVELQLSLQLDFDIIGGGRQEFIGMTEGGYETGGFVQVLPGEDNLRRCQGQHRRAASGNGRVIKRSQVPRISGCWGRRSTGKHRRQKKSGDQECGGARIHRDDGRRLRKGRFRTSAAGRGQLEALSRATLESSIRQLQSHPKGDRDEGSSPIRRK